MTARRSDLWRGARLAAAVLCVAAGAWTATAQATGASEAPRAASCEKIVLTGEVSAKREWKAAFGEGWVFRVLPIQTDKSGAEKTGADKMDAERFSGWDLVVDREPPAGYPDALLLATPSYNSINEREVGTTYGLRAQDAIGWNPRSFRFMTNPAAFKKAQSLFLSLSRAGWGQPFAPALAGTRRSEARNPGNMDAEQKKELQRLTELAGRSSAGEFRILGARLTPGTGDAVPYAENWALQSRLTPQTDVAAPGGTSTPRGEIEWIRFSVTLWLPHGWISPRELHAVRAGCSE
ncbi:MAG: hypothetical protein ACRD19_17515 [Terriglobia bacterium]